MAAQHEAVRRFINSANPKLIAEFAEVESSRRKDPPELAKAIALWRKEHATLVIAKLASIGGGIP